MEPEQPIEKVLKAAAAKRREQAGEPFRLHPAERRLLQGEVLRTFGRSQQKSARPFSIDGLREQLWPRLGWTFAVLTGVVAAALLMWPTPRESSMELASVRDSAGSGGALKSQSRFDDDRLQSVHSRAARSPSPTEEKDKQVNRGLIADDLNVTRHRDEELPASSPTPRPTAAPAGSAQLADPGNVARLHSSTTKADDADHEPVSGAPAVTANSSPAGPVAASAMPQGKAETQSLGLDQDGILRGKKASAKIAGLAQATQYSLSDGAFDFKADRKASERQRFTQVKAEAVGGQSSIDTLLRTFEIQQTTTGLQIVDSDGSIYEGTLAPEIRPAGARRAPSPPALAKTAGNERKIVAQSKAEQTPVAYRFTASGTNRTLNENLTLSGEISLLTQTNAELSNSLKRTYTVSNSSAVLPLFNDSRISAEAQVGDRVFRFDAVPVK
jgi:hypothetical protein